MGSVRSKSGHSIFFLFYEFCTSNASDIRSIYPKIKKIQNQNQHKILTTWVRGKGAGEGGGGGSGRQSTWCSMGRDGGLKNSEKRAFNGRMINATFVTSGRRIAIACSMPEQLAVITLRQSVRGPAYCSHELLLKFTQRNCVRLTVNQVFGTMNATLQQCHLLDVCEWDSDGCKVSLQIVNVEFWQIDQSELLHFFPMLRYARSMVLLSLTLRAFSGGYRPSVFGRESQSK